MLVCDHVPFGPRTQANIIQYRDALGAVTCARIDVAVPQGTKAVVKMDAPHEASWCVTSDCLIIRESRNKQQHHATTKGN